MLVARIPSVGVQLIIEALLILLPVDGYQGMPQDVPARKEPAKSEPDFGGCGLRPRRSDSRGVRLAALAGSAREYGTIDSPARGLTHGMSALWTHQPRDNPTL